MLVCVVREVGRIREDPGRRSPDQKILYGEIYLKGGGIFPDSPLPFAVGLMPWGISRNKVIHTPKLTGDLSPLSPGSGGSIVFVWFLRQTLPMEHWLASNSHLPELKAGAPRQPRLLKETETCRTG